MRRIIFGFFVVVVEEGREGVHDNISWADEITPDDLGRLRDDVFIDPREEGLE